MYITPSQTQSSPFPPTQGRDDHTVVPRTQLEAAPGATQCNALIILRICAFFQ